MILVDFSGICLATILINKENDERMIRHMTLNSLRMYNQKFKEDFDLIKHKIGGRHTRKLIKCKA